MAVEQDNRRLESFHGALDPFAVKRKRRLLAQPLDQGAEQPCSENVAHQYKDSTAVHRACCHESLVIRSAEPFPRASDIAPDLPALVNGAETGICFARKPRAPAARERPNTALRGVQAFCKQTFVRHS